MLPRTETAFFRDRFPKSRTSFREHLEGTDQHGNTFACLRPWREAPVDHALVDPSVAVVRPPALPEPPVPQDELQAIMLELEALERQAERQFNARIRELAGNTLSTRLADLVRAIDALVTEAFPTPSPRHGPLPLHLPHCAMLIGSSDWLTCIRTAKRALKAVAQHRHWQQITRPGPHLPPDHPRHQTPWHA